MSFFLRPQPRRFSKTPFFNRREWSTFRPALTPGSSRLAVDSAVHSAALTRLCVIVNRGARRNSGGMQGHVSRLVGLDGFEVKALVEGRHHPALEVEVGAGAACCPRCGRGTLDVKERPVVRVRDLSIAGKAVWLRWRKRRYRCQGCRRTFTESHAELPSRQRVTRRYRRGGASGGRPVASRSTRPTTGAAASWPRSPRISTAGR